MQFDEIQRRSREIFRIEATDLLGELEEALLALEADPSSAPLIDRVFRVMHTLKGSGATSGYQELSDFLHRVEDVFNAAREKRLQINSSIVDLTLKLGDAVSRYLGAAPAEAPAILAAAQTDLASLLAFLPAKSAAKKKAATAGEAPGPERFSVCFRPQRDLFRNGSDPGMFLDDLRALGPCTVRGFADELPALAELDPEACYLRWEAEVETSAGEAAVRDVFLFLDGACELDIKPIGKGGAAPAVFPTARTWFIEFQTTAKTMAAPDALETLWRDLAKLGRHQILASPISPDGQPAAGIWRVSLETGADADAVGDAFLLLFDAHPKIGLTPFPADGEPSRAPAPGPDKGGKSAEGGNGPAVAASGETLRVSADRLDRLVNLVGELVILRSQVSDICANTPNVGAELQGASETLQSLTSEMRDVVLNLRMMPIEQTFGKFRRLVRDLSRDLGKEVNLVIEGGETEIDKTMLDALADPLMHLVRNSLDHGLEAAAERVAAGKPAAGTLRLRAEQNGDRVIVSVRDNGRGLNTEKIRAKAISKGLLPADAHPPESELHAMIFLAGFSTSDTVSQVSGRGVGLDVVRRQIEKLRGKVDLRSELGRGTEFRLSLPLTLAIIEGLMVEVGDERFILPLGFARETIELSRAQRSAGNGRNVVNLRGAWVPYLRLRDLFGFDGEPPDPELVVVVELEDQRIGLGVDRVIGNHQTVIKSLGWLGRRVPVFAGSTVLGNGRVALILDLPALLAHFRESRGIGSGLEI
jgi:two-component system chemotaxis sensor kinase CheA